MDNVASLIKDVSMLHLDLCSSSMVVIQSHLLGRQVPSHNYNVLQLKLGYVLRHDQGHCLSDEGVKPHWFFHLHYLVGEGRKNGVCMCIGAGTEMCSFLCGLM